MKSLSVERLINAPSTSVWEVVSDVGSYAQYAPNLATSKVVSGEGVGLVRECSSKEGRWQELCTAWEEKQFFRFQVQTQANDYPFPFKTLNGKWEVHDKGNEQATIRMEFEVEFKHAIVGWLVFPIMKIKYLQVCEELLDNWQQEVLKAEQV